jgi:tRNA (mo5U34)-methyltransferase
LDGAALRAEIERLGPWLHDIELAPGIRTGGAPGSADPDHAVGGHHDPAYMMNSTIGDVYGGGLDGRSFLDCGCNAAGHSFAAARLGAGRVFAFDARQHWIDQAALVARCTGETGVELARMTLADLPGAGLPSFDVTLFSGLFYHLPDPVAGLKLAADLTGELLIVNTSFKPLPWDGLSLSSESATIALSGIDGLAWLPSGPAVMAPILAWCGFPHMRVAHAWEGPGPAGWWRMHILAARDEALFERFDKVHPDGTPKRSLATRAKHRLARMLLS